MKTLLLPILIPLACLLVLPHAAATWSLPVKITENRMFMGGIEILSLYRDPASSVNHAFVSVGTDSSTIRNHYYVAIADNGTVIYNTSFSVKSQRAASIRGVGDGKGLFLVYSSGAANLMFSESSDGGENWSLARNIAEDVYLDYKLLGDMIRVDSGRLIVFLIHKVQVTEAYIKMLSRPTGSSVFSKESIVSSDVGYNDERPVAAYGYRGGKLRLHVAYIRSDGSDTAVVYTYSDNNGVSWSKGRDLDGTTEVASINYMKGFGSHVYIAYQLSFRRANLLQLAHSTDFGATFSPPQMFYVRHPMELTTCGARNYKKLASLRHAERAWVEYAMWDPATLKSTDASNITLPGISWVTDAAIDCTVDVKKGLRKIVALMTNNGDVNQLFVSVDTSAID